MSVAMEDNLDKAMGKPPMSIGNHLAFAAHGPTESQYGMTYRQWLIGMVAAGHAGRDCRHGEIIACANAIIACLDAEADAAYQAKLAADQIVSWDVIGC